jgi:hypothetical protein
MTLPLSSRIYSRLLVLYPADLRRDFGDQMALVFAEDLDAARRRSGLRGEVRVWRCALGEFLRLALPGRLASPPMRAPVIAVGFALSSLSLELLAHLRTGNPARCIVLGTLFSFLPVLIPLLVIWSCRGQDVTSLRLSDRTRQEP